ncbi:CRISPR-associated protein [Clostridium botulinum]|nr:CRISPR-associated protein [Clostridium botulinum]
MYKYPITIELLSETIFGNGQSKNGIVNTDILLDEDGFPYYLGKTFKGCLKESINTILKSHYKNQCKVDELVDKLFGFSNEKGQCEGKLKFTNFYLDKTITDIFSEYEVLEDKKDLILSALADIRFSIKMGGNGVSESTSLRALRVVKKGLVFNGFVECLDELSEEEAIFLKRGIKSLKNLGINKSRGKGLVHIRIGEKIELNSKIKKDINYDFDYLLYEINLKQPVKIGDSQSQYDYEQTKSYISGSIVRGAIINKYLNLNNINPSKAEENKYFNSLLKKVYFYDAYPIYEEAKGDKYYTFPTPNIFRITKDRDKEDDNCYKNKEFSIVFDEKKINNEPMVIKLKKGDFSYYKDNTLYQFNIKKDYRFHHSQELKKQNIFRYESISRGQKFYGIVDVSLVDAKLKKELYNLLDKKEILYLGGSRTSGYGKTEICNTKLIKNFSKLKEILDYLKCDEPGNELNIYFLSDAILRDENHQIVSTFSKKYLNEKLKINLEKQNLINKDINPIIVTGYNSKWRSSIPHVYGIEKGSNIKINIDNFNNRVEEDIINNFIKSQHGDRKQDGFGRVIINPKFLEPHQIKYIGTNKTYNEEREIGNFQVDNKVINYIKKCKNEVFIDKIIKKQVIKKQVIENVEEFHISNSQINNIISHIDKCLICDGNPIDEFKNEFERLNKVTQNEKRTKDNYNILNYPLIENKNLKELIKSAEEVGKINEIIKDILLNGLVTNEYEKENVIKQIIENNFQDNFEKEKILLKIIRDIFYYSIKSKRGDDNE